MSGLLIVEDSTLDARRLRYELEDGLDVPVRYVLRPPTDDQVDNADAIVIDLRRKASAQGDEIARDILARRPGKPVAIISATPEAVARQRFDLAGLKFLEKDCATWWDEIAAFVAAAMAGATRG